MSLEDVKKQFYILIIIMITNLKKNPCIGDRFLLLKKWNKNFKNNY